MITVLTLPADVGLLGDLGGVTMTVGDLGGLAVAVGDRGGLIDGDICPSSSSCSLDSDLPNVAAANIWRT